MLRMVTGALSLAVLSGCVVGYEYRQRPYTYGYGTSSYGSAGLAVADYNPGCSPDLPCDNTYYWDEWRSVYVYFDGARYHDATGLPGAYRPPPPGMGCGGVPMGYTPPSNYRGRPGQFSAPPSYRTPSWWASNPPPPPGNGYASAPGPNPGRGYGSPPVANAPSPSGPPPGQSNSGGIPAPRGWYGHGARPPSSQTIDDGAHGGPSQGWPQSGPVGQGSPRPPPVVLRPQGEFPSGKPQLGTDDVARGGPSNSSPVARPSFPNQPMSPPSRPTAPDAYASTPPGRVPGSGFPHTLPDAAPSRPSTMARNEGPHPQQQTFAGVTPKRDLRYRVDMDPLPSYDMRLPKLSPPPPPNPQATMALSSPSFPSRKPTVFGNSPSAPSVPSAPGGPSQPMFGPRPRLR